MSQDIRFRITLDGAQEFQQGTAAAAKGLDGVAAATQRVTQTQKQAGQNAAQLSAQIQDFVVQVSSGGSPITALLQQGSQLATVYGGVGNAFRAITSLITPMVAALGGAAAVVGTIVLGYKAGAEEADNFARSIAATGNAAGTTAGRLQQLAEAQDKVAGTRAKAADVLVQLVSGGTIAEQQLAKATNAAIQLERAGGAAVDATAAKFVKLGQAPLQTLTELNKAENFLTRTLYDQVRALEAQGKHAEAAAVAIDAYAELTLRRAGELEPRLGTIERMWRGIKDAVKEAGDAIAGIGRQTSTEDQLAGVQTRIATLRRNIEREASFGRSVSPRDARDLQQLEAEEQALTRMLALQRRRAQADRDAAQATKEYIEGINEAAAQAATAAQAQFLRTSARIKGELDQIESKAKRGLLSPIEAIEQTGQKRLELLRAEQRLQQANLAAAQQRTAKQSELGAMQAQISAKAIEIGNAEKAIQLEIAEAMYARQQAAEKAYRTEQAEGQAAIDALNAQFARTYEKAAEAVADYAREIDEANELTRVELQMIGATDQARALAIERLRIEIKEREQLRRIKQQDGLSGDEREQLSAQVRSASVRAQAQAEGKVYAEEWRKTSDIVAQSLSDALMDGGKDAADYIKGLFRSLVLRPLVQGIVQPVAGDIASFLTGGGGGTGGGSLQQLQGLYGLYQKAAAWWGGGTAVAGYGTVSANLAAAYGGNAAAAAGFTSMAAAGEGGAAAGAGLTAAGGSSAAAAIPIIGWIIAAIAQSSANYKAGNTVDMLGDKWYGIGAVEKDKYRTLSALGFSEKWAQILSGAPLTARLLGHKPSSSGFGFGTVAGGDFMQTLSSPISFGRNTLGGGVDEGLQGLAADIAAAVGLAAGAFGGKLTEGLRVGAFTDRDRDNEVSALLGFFGADNKLLTGVQTGSGTFVGAPGNAGKISADELQQWISDQMPVLIIQGLRQSQLDKRFTDYFDAIGDASKLTPEKAKGLLEVATAVQQLTETFSPLGGVFQQFGTITVETFEKLAKGGGGFEQLGAQLGAFYQEFYTGAKQTEIATQGVRDALASVGLVMPDLSQSAADAHAQYLAMVNAQDLNTEAGRKAFNVLLANAAAFDQLSDSADQAARRLEATVRSVAPKFLSGEELRSFQLQGIADTLRREAGVETNVAQLMGMTKDQIRDFVEAFLALSGASVDAKIAVLEAADALVELGAFDPKVIDSRVQTPAQVEAGREAFNQWRGMQANAQLFNQQLQSGTLAGGLQQYVDSFWKGVENVPGPTLNGLFNAWMMQTDLGARVNANGIARNMGQEGGISNSQAMTDALREQENATRELIQSLDAVDESLDRFLDDLLTGGLSALSPEDRLKAARDQFDTFERQGLAGDAEAVRRAQEAAATLLQLQQEFSGAPAYSPVFDEIVARLEALQDAVQDRLEELNKSVDRGTETTAAGALETSSAVREGNSLAARRLTESTLEGARRAL